MESSCRGNMAQKVFLIPTGNDGIQGQGSKLGIPMIFLHFKCFPVNPNDG